MRIIHTWMQRITALLLCASCAAASVLPVAAGEPGGPRGAPFLFIESVLPHPGPEEAAPGGSLPPLPEGDGVRRVATLWNWDGTSPVSVQAVFQTFNVNVQQLEQVMASVNGQSIPEVWVAALSSPGFGFVDPDGMVDTNGLAQLTSAAVYKIRFTVPYEIDPAALKAHLTIRIEAQFKGGTTLAAVKHVTLLQGEDIQTQLVDLKAATVRLCENSLTTKTILGDLAGAIDTALAVIVAIINDVVGAFNMVIVAIVDGINLSGQTVIAGINGVLDFLGTINREIDIPAFSVQSGVFGVNISIDPPAFTVSGLLGPLGSLGPWNGITFTPIGPIPPPSIVPVVEQIRDNLEQIKCLLPSQ